MFPRAFRKFGTKPTTFLNKKIEIKKKIVLFNDLTTRLYKRIRLGSVLTTSMSDLS